MIIVNITKFMNASFTWRKSRAVCRIQAVT